MRNRKIALGGIAAVAVVGFAGTAMTASNTVANSVAGYGSSTVSGANVSAVEHSLSEDGTNIESTLVTFSTPLNSGHQVKAGFGDVLVECVETVNAEADDTALCSWDPAVLTSGAATFHVAVS